MSKVFGKRLFNNKKNPMNGKLCIITVVDNVSTTSMPVNEFVLYRQRKKNPNRQVLIVCSENNYERINISDGIDVHYVGGNVFFIRRVLLGIKRDCKNNNESIVCHLHGQKSALAFFIASIGMKLRRRTLYTIHSTYSSRDYKYKISSCVCALLANKVNCVSESSYKEYKPWVLKYKGENMFPISNGVDVERIDNVIGCENKMPQDVYSLVCVGRIIPIKNQGFLVRLLPSLPATRLVLIGEEKESYPVRDLAESIGVLDRVEFTGLIPRDDVYKKISHSGLYVSSSTVEGLPISVLEAMAAGLVPVLSDIAPHREIARVCNISCTLPLNENLWIEYIKLQQSCLNFKVLSDDIKEKIRAQYSLEMMHKKYNEIYEQLAK